MTLIQLMWFFPLLGQGTGEAGLVANANSRLHLKTFVSKSGRHNVFFHQIDSSVVVAKVPSNPKCIFIRRRCFFYFVVIPPHFNKH